MRPYSRPYFHTSTLYSTTPGPHNSLQSDPNSEPPGPTKSTRCISPRLPASLPISNTRVDTSTKKKRNPRSAKKIPVERTNDLPPQHPSDFNSLHAQLAYCSNSSPCAPLVWLSVAQCGLLMRTNMEEQHIWSRCNVASRSRPHSPSKLASHTNPSSKQGKKGILTHGCAKGRRLHPPSMPSHLEQVHDLMRRIRREIVQSSSRRTHHLSFRDTLLIMWLRYAQTCATVIPRHHDPELPYEASGLLLTTLLEQMNQPLKPQSCPTRRTRSFMDSEALRPWWTHWKRAMDQSWMCTDVQNTKNPATRSFMTNQENQCPHWLKELVTLHSVEQLEQTDAYLLVKHVSLCHLWLRQRPDSRIQQQIMKSRSSACDTLSSIPGRLPERLVLPRGKLHRFAYVSVVRYFDDLYRLRCSPLLLSRAPNQSEEHPTRSGNTQRLLATSPRLSLAVLPSGTRTAWHWTSHFHPLIELKQLPAKGLDNLSCLELAWNGVRGRLVSPNTRCHKMVPISSSTSSVLTLAHQLEQYCAPPGLPRPLIFRGAIRADDEGQSTRGMNFSIFQPNLMFCYEDHKQRLNDLFFSLAMTVEIEEVSNQDTMCEKTLDIQRLHRKMKGVPRSKPRKLPVHPAKHPSITNRKYRTDQKLHENLFPSPPTFLSRDSPQQRWSYICTYLNDFVYRCYPELKDANGLECSRAPNSNNIKNDHRYVVFIPFYSSGDLKMTPRQHIPQEKVRPSMLSGGSTLGTYGTQTLSVTRAMLFFPMNSRTTRDTAQEWMRTLQWAATEAWKLNTACEESCRSSKKCFVTSDCNGQNKDGFFRLRLCSSTRMEYDAVVKILTVSSRERQVTYLFTIRPTLMRLIRRALRHLEREEAFSCAPMMVQKKSTHMHWNQNIQASHSSKTAARLKKETCRTGTSFRLGPNCEKVAHPCSNEHMVAVSVNQLAVALNWDFLFGAHYGPLAFHLSMCQLGPLLSLSDQTAVVRSSPSNEPCESAYIVYHGAKRSLEENIPLRVHASKKNSMQHEKKSKVSRVSTSESLSSDRTFGAVLRKAPTLYSTDPTHHAFLDTYIHWRTRNEDIRAKLQWTLSNQDLVADCKSAHSPRKKKMKKKSDVKKHHTVV